MGSVQPTPFRKTRNTKLSPLSILSLVVVLGGIAWGTFTNLTSSTEVTVEVVLRPSDTVITQFAEFNSYETYFASANDEEFGTNPAYGPIFLADDRPNVFEVGNDVQAAFEATVGATQLGPVGTTGGGVEERTLTITTLLGLVRLDVQTDGSATAPDAAVTATLTGARPEITTGSYEDQSQIIPEDGPMVFLLPEGEWTFAVSGGETGQSTEVSVPRGDVVEAILDLLASN